MVLLASDNLKWQFNVVIAFGYNNRLNPKFSYKMYVLKDQQSLRFNPRTNPIYHLYKISCKHHSGA